MTRRATSQRLPPSVSTALPTNRRSRRSRATVAISPPQQLSMRLVADERGDMRPRSCGELHREQADSTRRPGDEDTAPGERSALA